MSRYTRTIIVFIAMRHIQSLWEERHGEELNKTMLATEIKRGIDYIKDSPGQVGQILSGYQLLSDIDLRKYERRLPEVLASLDCNVGNLESLGRDILVKYAGDVQDKFGEDIIHRRIMGLHKPNGLGRHHEILRGVWRGFWLRKDVSGRKFVGSNLMFLHNRGLDSKRASGFVIGRKMAGGYRVWDVVCEMAFHHNYAWTWTERGGDGKYFMVARPPEAGDGNPEISGLFAKSDTMADPDRGRGPNSVSFCLCVRLSPDVISESLLLDICKNNQDDFNAIKDAIECGVTGRHVGDDAMEAVASKCIDPEMTLDEFKQKFQVYAPSFLRAKNMQSVVSELDVLDDLVDLCCSSVD